jgi:hypothetical protein
VFNLYLCFSFFLCGLARQWSILASIDDCAGRALIIRGLGLFVGLVFLVIHFGKIVGYSEQLGLLCAQAAGYAAYRAHFASVFACFCAAARDDEHIFVSKGNHLYQVARTGLYTRSASGALLVIDSSKTIDDMQGVELTGGYAIAEAEASEFTGLDVRKDVGGGAGLYALVFGVAGFVVFMGAAVDDGAFGCAGVADLQIENCPDLRGNFGAARCAFADKLGIGDDSLGIGCAACISAGAAVDAGQGLVDLLDLRVNFDFQLDTGYEQDNSKDGGQTEHNQPGRSSRVPQFHNVSKYHLMFHKRKQFKKVFGPFDTSALLSAGF